MAERPTLEEIDVTELIEFADFERLALARMSGDVRAIVEYGLGLNETAWQRYALRPRALVDISACDTTTTVLGQPVKVPVLVGPHALQGLCHPEGEVATALGSARAGTIMALPQWARRTFEEVGEVGRFWVMLTFLRDRGLMHDAIRRASAAGATALCLTIDYYPLLFPAAPRDALRRIKESGYWSDAGFLSVYGEDELSSLDLSLDMSVTWSDLEWLREVSPLPLVLKGVMTAEDAKRAADHGSAAVVVSNHGAQTTHHTLPTAAVLPEVVEAVDGRLEVLVDGGIRSGADVLRALALGARAAMVARPSLCGLVLGGADGVQRVLSLMREELEALMAMTGARCIDEIDATMIALRG